MSIERPEFEIKQERSQPPTGEAKELSQLTQEKWQEHLLLFSGVKNKVLEVNPDVYTPLKLEEGKPSPLGLFAAEALKEKPKELPEGKHALEVWREHGRTAILGRAIFKDKEGRFYRDIDLKGIGAVRDVDLGTRPGIPGIMPGYHQETKHRGLLDKESAFYDYQMSEKFLAAGIRAPRVLAIIELEELIARQKKIPVEILKKEGYIDKNFQPVVEVRGFGTRFRIYDIDIEQNPGESRLIVEDAKKLVSQELGLKKSLSDKGYLEWFAKTLGQNVGLMHKNGYYHRILGAGHNVTLDCRILDLDSAGELTTKKERVDDVSEAKRALSSLASGVGEKGTSHFTRLFRQSYDAIFSSKEQEQYFKQIKKK